MEMMKHSQKIIKKLRKIHQYVESIAFLLFYQYFQLNSTYLLQPPIEINPNEHKLQYAYALWYSRRSPGKQPSIQSYDQNLKLVGRFASVEQFWSLYSHLVRPSELTTSTDFHLFKVGIKPMWEVCFNILWIKYIFFKQFYYSKLFFFRMRQIKKVVNGQYD